MKNLAKKVLAVLAGAMLVLTVSVATTPVATVEAQSSIVNYEDSFDYTEFGASSLFSTDGAWVAENPTSGKDNFYRDQPEVKDGVMKIVEGSSAQLNWEKLDGFSFSSNKTYTLKFDVKITDFGNDTGGVDPMLREFYFAPGGWFNQIEMKNNTSANKCLRAGDSYAGNVGAEYKLNVVYSIEVVWSPAQNKITSTIKNGSSVIVSGYRTNAEYGSNAHYMSNWVFRCEDGACEVDNFSFSDGSKVYTQDFSASSGGEGTMTASGYWALETEEKSGVAAPEIENGVVKMVTGTSVEFKWTKLADYSPDNAYIFEFDFRITNEGNGNEWGNDSSTRALYVASGGYYNHIEIPNKNNNVRAGDTYLPYDTNVYLGKTMRAKLVHEGNSVSASIYDQNGNCVIAGTRVNEEFTNISAGRMDAMVIRCEDGAFDLDNFRFSAEKNQKESSEEIEIKNGKSAEYSCEIDYKAGSSVSVKLNNTGVFAISDEGLSVCSAFVTGSYGAGKYGFNLTVNQAQQMAVVEITLPDGGKLQRGTYAVLNKSATEYLVDVYARGQATVSGVTVTSDDIILNEYEITDAEPTYSGFEANAYNLVSSFSDASTTRSFAWTAKTSFATPGMSIKYRVKDTAEWESKSATLDNEKVNFNEDYFKVDLINLKPSTEYEYRIGLTESADEQNEWSKSYFFKTASGNEDEFTFVAVGDTQGITWGGEVVAQKGFKYAKSAYEEAMQEVENPAFIMHAGDVVENGGNVEQWNMFFKALSGYGASVPHFATIGNHDTVNVGSASTPKFYFNMHFNHPDNGGQSAIDKVFASQIGNANLSAMAKVADETIYSYNYGDAHFIVLNTGNYSTSDEFMIKAQRAWLEADLKANACAKWTVILCHEAVYHRVGGNESRPWLYDTIEKYGVDLVIQGHSHLVTRSYPMKNGQIVSKKITDTINQGDGTVYTTIGSTALNHDSLGSPNVEEMYKIITPANELSAYTTVTVNGDKLVMTVKQIDGLVLDRFEILADESKPDHVGQETLVGQEDATCTSDGYTGDKYCSLCAKLIQSGEPILSDGHAFDKREIADKYLASEATCSSKATYYYSCKCGEKGEQTFEHGSTIPHSLPDQHTCHDRVCLECGEKILATSQHEFGEGVVTTQPTTTAEGEKTYACVNCNETKTEKIDKLEADETEEKGGCATVAPTGGNDGAGGVMGLITLLGIALILVKSKAKRVR